METITPMPAGIDVRNRSNGQSWIIVHDLELGSLRFPLPDHSTPATTTDALTMALATAQTGVTMLEGSHAYPTALRTVAARHRLQLAYLAALVHRQVA